MVVYEQETPSHGSYIVSLSVNVAGMREQISGDTIVIHVNYSTVVLSHVVTADAVRKALIQIEALQTTCPLLKMPKRISPSY
jgi:hypothetical protein